MFIAKLKPFAWIGILLAVVLLAGGVILLEKPMGGMAGHIAIQEPGFNLATYNIRDKKVYALAIGPRGSRGEIQERGVWIQPDGTYRLDRLPVGEYTLKIRALGFQTHYEHGIFVEEGKVTPVKTVSLALLSPTVNIASNSRVFTTQEQPRFWVNAMGGTQATIKLYRQDMLERLKESGNNPEGMEFGSELGLYKPSNGELPEFLDREKPVAVMNRKLEMDAEDWARANIALSKPLPRGDYLVVVEVSGFQDKRDWNWMWFTVSDLGLVVKHAPDKTVVRAVDLNTLQPRPGVSVQLLDQESSEPVMAAQQTGPTGLTEFTLPTGMQSKSSYNLIAYGQQGQDRAYGGIPFWRDANELYQTYFYTERPIYRLGQTVYFKGITRILEGNGFRNPKAGLPLTLVVEDPDNNKLWQGEVQTNAHGSFHGLFEIPAEGKTGAYQVTIQYPDGTLGYERFEVAQYRKPEYQVDVMPLKNRIVAGQRAKARIRATYLFGAPVTHARVKYSIYAAPDWQSRYKRMPRPDYYDYYDDWEEDFYEDSGYAGDYITEGYAQTDENGEALIEFDTSLPQQAAEGPMGENFWDKRYKIQAEVTDLSRIAVIGSGALTVANGDFLLFVQPRQYVVKAGEPLEADVMAVDQDGRPMANQTIAMDVMRWTWDERKGTYRAGAARQSAMVVTNAQGKAQVRLAIPNQVPTDTYYVTARTKDTAGRLIYDEASVWVASSHYPYALAEKQAEQEPLALALDKPVYQPGETAKMMITAPVTGKENIQALVSIESTQIHELRTIPLTATAQLVEIPLKAIYAPNVYITVTMVGKKHQFYTQTQLIKVSPQHHFLKLQVTADKPQYHPGESVTYTIQATYPDGRPAQDTEISLGVVDESIYSIRPEAAPDIQKFFYNKRPNWVMTLSSFPEEYSGGPDKIEPRVRKDFRDMAAWFPNLVTNAQGIATATVQLPDNLTTWRATVRAVSRETDVAATLHKVIATQDLLVRLALPRFFTQGDEGLLTAIVHNYTDKPQTVGLTLQSTSQFRIQEALWQRVSVQPDGAQRFTWHANAANPGEATLIVKAIGQTAGDALELKVPIRPLGIESFVLKSGLLQAESDLARIPLTLPAGVNPLTAWYQLSLAASSLGPVLGNFGALIDFPYGCTEQTMSRLMPAVIAVRLNQTLHVPLPPGAQNRFQSVYTQAMAKLNSYQNEDGGWGWWGNDESNAYLTAYVMEGFHLLTQAGYHVEKDRLNRTKVWLRNATGRLLTQLQDPKLAHDVSAEAEAFIDLAQMQYALALHGDEISTKARDWLLSQQNRMPPEALSLLILAFNQSGERGVAQKLYQTLRSLANRTGESMIDWDQTPALLKRLSTKGQLYTYRFTGIESTALALRATVALHPRDAATLEGIKAWLLLQRQKEGWGNTKTTAQVLRALMEEEIASKNGTSTGFSVATNLASLAQTSFDETNQYQAETMVRMAFSTLKDTAVHIAKNGPGRLYYHSLLMYVTPLKPGSENLPKAVPEGLTIRRAFYRLEASPMGVEGKIRFTPKPLGNTAVRAGETLLMKLHIESPVALPYLIVDASLPSGGEVISNDPREDLLNNTEDDTGIEGNWGSWWWTHQDILDDRMVFFTTRLPAGKSELHALIRMELPGTFQMNPVNLAGMYTRNIRAYSTLDSIKVVE